MNPAIAGRLKTGIVLLFLALFAHGCLEEETVLDNAIVSSSAPPASHSGLAVNEVLERVGELNGKEIAVFGKASGGLAFEFVTEQPYQLETGKAKLWVITSDLAPQDGTWLTVKGVLRAPYQVKGRHYDVVLVEKMRLQ